MLAPATNVPAAMMTLASYPGMSHGSNVTKLSTPVLATIGLYYAVFFWNDWFYSLLYLKGDQYPVMMFLRNIVNGTMELGGASGGAEKTTMSLSIKGAVIVTSTLPIILVYPFLQRFFVKGLTLGGIKG